MRSTCTTTNPPLFFAGSAAEKERQVARLAGLLESLGECESELFGDAIGTESGARERVAVA
jgi:hypothetical protein